MKKIISLFMALATALSLAACSANEAPDEVPEDSSSQTNESTPTPNKTEGKNLVVYFSMPETIDSYFQTRRAMNDNRVLMPVPTSVLEDNTNIEQNLGY